MSHFDFPARKTEQLSSLSCPLSIPRTDGDNDDGGDHRIDSFPCQVVAKQRHVNVIHCPRPSILPFIHPLPNCYAWESR